MVEIFLEQLERSCSFVGLKSYLWFLMVAAVMFVPLEIFFRAKPHRWFRQEWGTDLLFFSGQFFLFNGLSIACLMALSQGVETLNLYNLQAQIAAQPYWLQVFEIVFLCDISIYLSLIHI